MTTVSLVLAFVDLSIWIRQRRLAVHLTFALCSLSAAAIAIFELWMMQAQTPEQWALLDRWVHVPTTTLRIGLVLFVALQFPAARRGWVAPLIVLLLAALAANFLSGANIDFREVTALASVAVWHAAPVRVPAGDPNPWLLLGELNALLMIAFLIDTILRVRRHGDAEARRRVIPVGASIIVFLLVVGVWRVIVTYGLVAAPLLVAPPFLGISLVMAILIGGDILRASEKAASLVAAEALLLETTEQMDLAASVSGLGSWTWDRSSGALRLSPAACMLLGFAPDDATGWTQFLSRLPPEDRERVEQCVATALRTDGHVRVEFRVVGSGSEPHQVAALGKILFQQDRTPVHSFGVVVDVTERSMAEERFRLLVESMPAAILLVNDSGTIAFGNRQAEAMFGYAHDHLIGMAVEALMPDRVRAGHADLRRIFGEKPAVRAMGAGLELAAQRSDGSEILVEIGLTPIQIAEEHFIIASICEIGERKRLEREAATQRDELAHLSRAASLSALSSSLAHELNQPLTAILSNAQAGVRFLAHQPPDMEEVRVSFTNVVDNAKRAGEVIRKLRSMLRNDRTEFIRLDLNDVVREVMEIVRSDLIDRRVEVVLELAADLPPVKGDRVQLQQVLLNLMMNAAEAMGGVAHARVLTVCTLPIDGDVEVQVADTGPGIPPDDLARIFAPFVTGKKGGMGLGLSVCSMLIQAHGGRLWATNNDTGGATLRFHLPAYDSSGPRRS